MCYTSKGLRVSMDEFVVRGNLFELYGGLLNENQRKVYEYHVMDDMSFTEIGEELGVTRQAAQSCSVARIRSCRAQRKPSDFSISW